MSKSKDIGTWTETSTVNLLHDMGFSKAHRRELKGRKDVGDIDVIPGADLLMIEVKGGKAAEQASRNQIEDWLQETWTEQENGGFAHAFLVTKRAGYGNKRTGLWNAHTTLGRLNAMLCLSTYEVHHPLEDFTVTMRLVDLLAATRRVFGLAHDLSGDQ